LLSSGDVLRKGIESNVVDNRMIVDGILIVKEANSDTRTEDHIGRPKGSKLVITSGFGSVSASESVVRIEDGVGVKTTGINEWRLTRLRDLVGNLSGMIVLKPNKSRIAEKRWNANIATASTHTLATRFSAASHGR